MAGAPPPPFYMNHLPIGPGGEPVHYGLVDRDGDYATVTPVTNLTVGRIMSEHTGMPLVQLLERDPEDM